LTATAAMLPAPALDKDGYLPVPQGPGLGLSFKPDLIEQA
jgi:L-alanine-DL-glutamate epimerase-like enolase superfamily enzyme